MPRPVQLTEICLSQWVGFATSRIPYHRAAFLVSKSIFVFTCDYDQMSDLTKIRNAGWIGANPSEAMYLRLLQGLRDQRIIP